MNKTPTINEIRYTRNTLFEIISLINMKPTLLRISCDLNYCNDLGKSMVSRGYQHQQHQPYNYDQNANGYIDPGQLKYWNEA